MGMFRLLRGMALGCVVGFGASQSIAGEVSWGELASHPERYVGKAVEVRPTYCGASDEGVGYVCATSGPLYIAPSVLTPGTGKRKIDANCGAIDWIERNPGCLVKLRFTPQGYHTSTELAPGKSVVVIETAEATATY